MTLAAGTRLGPVTTLSETRKQTTHSWPFFPTDGRRFIFVAMAANEEGKGVFLSQPGGAPVVVA